MSAEQRSPVETPSADEFVATRRYSRFETASDSTSVRHSNVKRTGHSSLAEQPLHSRIERTRLQLQVAALERALEASEHCRQTVIDRYEHILAERETTVDHSSTPEPRSDSFVKRLLRI